MSYKVLALKHMDQIGVDMLAKIGAQVIIAPAGCAEDDWVKIIEEEQVDCIYSRTDVVTPRMMAASKNLKVVAKQGVGLDNFDMKYANEHKIPVIWAPGGNTNAVAEHAIMLMLLCAVRFRHVDNEMRNGNFGVRYTLTDTWELKGRTLGLLGCGRVGQNVAKIAANGFGMKIIGYDPYPPMDPIVPIDMMEMDEVLAKADFVSLHMPSNPSTRHSIDYEKFCKMKPSGVFINCARGNIIVEADLVRALQEGKLAGAGLDVFEQEPLPMSSPLMALEQVVLTPHTAASTNQSVRNCTYMACQGIIDALLGHRSIANMANKF